MAARRRGTTPTNQLRASPIEWLLEMGIGMGMGMGCSMMMWRSNNTNVCRIRAVVAVRWSSATLPPPIETRGGALQTKEANTAEWAWLTGMGMEMVMEMEMVMGNGMGKKLVLRVWRSCRLSKTYNGRTVKLSISAICH